MKRYIFAAYILCLMISLVGCQDSDDQTADGSGYLQVSSVELDKTVIPQKTKAMTRATEKLALDILKEDGTTVVKHVEDWTTLQSESVELAVGNYILRAYSADKDATLQGVDALPYYMGETPVSVEKNVAKTVEVTCSLAQSMVSVSYSANFKSAFTAYESIITNEYGSVTLPSTETKPAYFRADKELNSVLKMTNTDGKSFNYPSQIAEIAKKRYHYKINYDVTTNGTGSFTFTVDQTTKEYKVSITVPLTPSGVDPLLQATEANAWGKFAYLYGTFDPEGDTNPVTFQYKETSGKDWISVAATLDEGVYMAKTNELDFSKTYDYRLACGARVGNVEIFTTESFEEIPNLNFDTWTSKLATGTDPKTNWFANAVAVDNTETGAYWATGNTGVTSSLAGKKDPITIPVEGEDAYRGKAARLRTITGVTLVKSAAGNLFIGKYKTNMFAPAKSVTFGRPYSGARPVALSGYYKYDSQPINEGTKPGTLTTDECHIYVKLWDALGNEIGYGEFVGTESVDTYAKFSFDINYTDPVAKPATITIVATSSHYGGDFTGSTVTGQVGAGSTLWIDEFELSYFK